MILQKFQSKNLYNIEKEINELLLILKLKIIKRILLLIVTLFQLYFYIRIFQFIINLNY